MFAIIETGGKQYKVKAGDQLDIELLEGVKARRAGSRPSGKDEKASAGQGEPNTVKLDKVLMVSKEGSVEVGRPFLKGAFCEAEVLQEFKGPKVVSFKYIRREKSATKIGHRQKYLKVKIKSIHPGA